jgi:hypothetical protein
MKTRQRWAAAVLAGGLLLGSTACGGGGDSGTKDASSDSADQQAIDDFAAQPAGDIKDQVVADMKGVDSLTMSAAITSNGEQIAMDLSMDTDGQCTGSVDMKGGTAQIMSVGGDVYLKGDADFWKATAGDQADTILSVLDDRWAKQSGTGGFGSFCDLDGLLSSFDDQGSDASNAPDPTIGDVVDYEGQQALQLVTEQASGTTTVWVAAETPHYILKMENAGETEPGTITLTDFNVPLEVTAPAEGDYVDLSTL